MTVRLYVRLIHERPDSGHVLDDIWSMLQRIAEINGCAPLDGQVESATVRWANVPESAVFTNERGLHRVQYVPKQSLPGRVETCVVSVDLLRLGEGAGVAESGAVLKTYNYLLRRVTIHKSGRHLPLDAVLSGELTSEME